MRLIRCLVVCGAAIAACAFTSLVVTRSQQEDTPRLPPVEFIAAELKESLSRLTSAEAEVVMTRTTPEEIAATPEYEGTVAAGTVRRTFLWAMDGDRLKIELTSAERLVPGGEPEPIRAAFIYVLDGERATLVRGSPREGHEDEGPPDPMLEDDGKADEEDQGLRYQVLITSPAGVPRQTWEEMDPRTCGWRIYRYPAAEFLLSKAGPDLAVTVEGVEERHGAQCHRIRARDKMTGVIAEIWVDATGGGLVREMRSYVPPDSALFGLHAVESVTEVDGIALPTEWRADFWLPAQQGPLKHSETVFTTTYTQVNEPVAAETFAVNIPDGSWVVDDLAGKEYVLGEPVPGSQPSDTGGRTVEGAPEDDTQ